LGRYEAMRELRNQYRSRKRILIRDGVGVYHVISRMVRREFLLGPQEREAFCGLLHQQAEFAGIEVLSFCVMSNHVHLLLRVPPVESFSDSDLLARYARYYGADKVPLSAYSVEELRCILQEGGSFAASVRARILCRMGNLPAFMRELKQRFSIWYNHKHENQGTIWAARYKSLIVEDAPETLTRVAAYIDLNPVRAEIVTGSKDYRWCSYAAALVGQGRAREGLLRLFGQKRDYSEALAAYRLILYGTGYQSKRGVVTRVGTIPVERLEAVVRQNGRVPLAELLRIRIRYFADGVALGSKEFVERTFNENRGEFGPNRKRGGVPLPEGAWGGTHVLRDLKRSVYG
jgi:putative transposase